LGSGFVVASKIKLDLEVSEALAHNARRLHSARITTTWICLEGEQYARKQTSQGKVEAAIN